MENNKAFEKLIRDSMSIDALEIKEPELSLVEEARKKILLRKKTQQKETRSFNWLIEVIQAKLKLYQVGVSVLLTFICFAYSLDTVENKSNVSVSGNYNNEMITAKNTTISVNSSTLLTSIPTLIIRN